MLQLQPFSFVDRACHPETTGRISTGTSIELITSVTYLSHDQSRLVTYVTDCYAKVGPTFSLVQLSWTNFICWSNKNLDKKLATLLLEQWKISPGTVEEEKKTALYERPRHVTWYWCVTWRLYNSCVRRDFGK